MVAVAAAATALGLVEVAILDSWDKAEVGEAVVMIPPASEDVEELATVDGEEAKAPLLPL